MKKKCQVLILDRHSNNTVIVEDVKKTLPKKGSDLYLLAIETVYTDEWCFEKYPEYESTIVRTALKNNDSAWLRQLNMDYFVENAVISSTFPLEHRVLPISFVDRLSQESYHNFSIDEFHIAKVIATSNPLLNCLYIDFDKSLKTSDIVEITIENNQIVNYTKL